jgi:hypothetical protein
MMKSPPTPVIVAYASFLMAAAGLYHMVSHNEDFFSAIFTISLMLQCLAMLFLAAQVFSTGGVAGISARNVGLEAFSSCCRLSSTLWLQGYLPVDESGDHFYQCVDLVTLATAAWLLYQILIAHRETYQADADTFPVAPLIFGSFVMAALFHSNMNLRPIFDTLWMASLNIGSVAVLPQLWLIMNTGGHVGPLMSHNIMAMCCGRMLGGYFFWMAREDITNDMWVEGYNHAILAIMGAHLLNLLLLADFGYVYVKAVATQGLQCTLELDSFATFV